MKTPNKRCQSGFTLVEIAIVLVIIGLLLGGVLKGTELIENSKVKRAITEVNGIGAAYYSYIDRFQRVPGDDGDLARIQGRGGNWANVTQNGNSNGILTANRNTTWNGNGEQSAFWQHLRAAGFVTGDVSLTRAAGQPRNAFGGLLGVVTQPVNGGLQGTKICISQVPGKSARAIDTQIDDGLGASGKTRATQGNGNRNPNNTALAAEYNDDNNYTVCTQI